MAIVYAFTADVFIFHDKINPMTVMFAVFVLSVTMGVSFYKVRYET